MIFSNLTAPEINALPRQIPVFLPVGSIEQHGGHLPVSTDSAINQIFCDALEERFGKRLLILPPVQITCSGHHTSLGGTLTVSHETFARYIGELVDSIVQQGFYNLVLFNSHGGNNAVGKCICEAAALRHPDLNIIFFPWWDIISDELARLCQGKTEITGHACEFETSLIMYKHPQAVRTDQIKNGDMLSMPNWAKGDLILSPPISLTRTMQQISKNGVQGDPRGATPEKGAKIVEAFISKMDNILQDITELPKRTTLL